MRPGLSATRRQLGWQVCEPPLDRFGLLPRVGKLTHGSTRLLGLAGRRPTGRSHQVHAWRMNFHGFNSSAHPFRAQGLQGWLRPFQRCAAFEPAHQTGQVGCDKAYGETIDSHLRSVSASSKNCSRPDLIRASGSFDSGRPTQQKSRGAQHFNTHDGGAPPRSHASRTVGTKGKSHAAEHDRQVPNAGRCDWEFTRIGRFLFSAPPQWRGVIFCLMISPETGAGPRPPVGVWSRRGPWLDDRSCDPTLPRRVRTRPAIGLAGLETHAVIAGMMTRARVGARKTVSRYTSYHP